MTIHAPAVERPPRLPEELLASTLFLLGRLGYLVKTRALEEFERSGFSLYEYSVLATLGEGACSTQAAVADALRLDRGQLVGVLDGLEERGLVERRRDPKDRRRHGVSLTSEGKRALVKLRRLVREVEDSVLAPLDEASRTSLHETLLRVAAHNDPRFARP